MKKAKRLGIPLIAAMMLSGCGGIGSIDAWESDFCDRVPPPPETLEIIDAIDRVPDPWQTWYGKLEADGFANCPEWK